MPRRDENRYLKPTNYLGTMKRLLAFMKEHLPSIIVAMLLTAGSALLAVVCAHLINPIIKSIRDMVADFNETTRAEFIRWLIYMSGCYIMAALLGYCSERIMTVVCNNTLNKIRNQMFTKLQKLPIAFFDRHTHGELMSYFTNDVGAIREAVSSTMISLIAAIITLVGSFVMMLLISPVLTIVIIVLIILMSFITSFIGSRSIRNFKSQQAAVAKLNGFMEEMMAGQKVVKVFTHEDEVKDEFAKINEQARKASTRANIYGGIMGPISGNLNYLNYAACAVLGANLVIRGAINVPDLIEFLQHSKNFANPLSRIMQQFNTLTRAIAGAERIFSILDTENEIDDGKITLVNGRIDENGQLTEATENTGIWAWKKPVKDGFEYIRLQGDVQFKNVDFSYDGIKQVLTDVSFYARPGQKIAFVGATGAGKTTITNLINRFYDIHDGQITYDGIDIKDIAKPALRSSLSMVLQDTHLFTGTVRENIRYGNLTATDQQVEDAARLANAHEFITMLPEGYDTVLSGDGANLSQGQRQLLAIARAAVSNPPVLILDEATSSIDTRTEKLIEEGMDNLMHGRTVFVIAHRLSTVRNANAIMVLEQGRIIERGDHDDLLKQKGEYYKLYTGQFELD